MFPFGQKPSTKEEPSKDCGYRCMYYCLDLREPYETWLEQFKFFQPTKSGITFTDICTVLNYYGKDFKYTALRDRGRFVIYSGIWLKPEGHNHGHYIVYENGWVYCSLKNEPYKLSLNDVIGRLEAKNIDGAFRVLEVL